MIHGRERTGRADRTQSGAGDEHDRTRADIAVFIPTIAPGPFIPFIIPKGCSADKIHIDASDILKTDTETK